MREWQHHTPFRVPTTGDFHFVDYLRESNLSGNVFHFGSGFHHHVGVACHVLNLPFHIHSTTSCKEEMKVYMEILDRNPDLMNHYRVMYGDVYSLKSRELPVYNVVFLPHLMEYSSQETPGVLDTGLMSILLDRLEDDGVLILWNGSNKFKETMKLIRNTDSINQRIKQTEVTKTLEVYRKVL